MRWDDDFKVNKWADLIKDLSKVSYKVSTASEDMSKALKGMNEDMKVYYVKFKGSDKLYAYYAAAGVNLQVGGIYSIVADNVTSYKNHVTVVKISNSAPLGVVLRTITSARQIGDIPRPNDRIKQVIFNHGKNTTVVLWDDGMKTIIKCQEGDEFDEEKALALCYMKRALGNRGSFNETLKKYCNQWGEKEE